MCSQDFSICLNITGHILMVMLLGIDSMTALDTKEFQKNLPGKVIWAVTGEYAELPCDVTPAIPRDNVTMIFWFKDNTGIPLYSLDARHGPLNKASHLAMTDDLGARSYFITEDEPIKARLRIQNVTAKDQGVFRCRVDFANSPTRNFQVNLSLVVQPSAPRIFDTEGREVIINSPAGPFLEDHELFLSCQVTGGHPKPSVIWFYNGTILDNVIDSSRTSVTIVNQLIINHLPRYYKGAHLECRTSSSDLAGYLIREVPIIVFLKPNKVKIVSPTDALSTSKSQNIRCEATGSYPPAKLRWLLDGKLLRRAIATGEEADAFSSSILSLKVVSENDGKDLICQAYNPRFPGGSAEDKKKIHVTYPPQVKVKMDSDATLPIKEGTDITLRCETLAHPAPHAYSWYQNNNLLQYNVSGDILSTDPVLILRNVSEYSNGKYTCSATNSEGEGFSASLDLQIQYAPRCRKGYEVLRVAALPYETMVIECHVDSIPEVYRFFWTYNTSKGVYPIQGKQMKNYGNMSVLHFTPGPDDIESLSCWATNDVGRQQTPCLFHIVPAEVPGSPQNCILHNTSYGDLEVTCMEGKDGGLRQNFVLEVTDIAALAQPSSTTLSDQGELQGPTYRAFGEKPIFRLPSMETGREYQVLVYAENARGKSSPPVVLPNIRIESEVSLVTHQESGATKDDSTFEGSANFNGQSLIIIVGLATAAVLLIVSIMIVAAVKVYRRAVVQRQELRSIKQQEEFDLAEAGFRHSVYGRRAQCGVNICENREERTLQLTEGPDLVLATVPFPGKYRNII